MRKIFIFSCLLVLTGLCASSQPWKKGGGGASPASATPATAGTAGAAGAATPATSGTSQTGYVYRLKAGKHLQYASLKSETHYFLRSALPARILGLPVQSGQLITASIILDRKANAALLQSGIRSFQEYDIRSIVKQVSCKPAPPGSCTAPGRQDSTASQGAVASQPSSGGTSGASGAPDTALAVTILYYDSLPRFTDHGLRLFITQDTAILQAKIFNRKFDINIKTDQKYSVTNRNYQSQFELGKKARHNRERSQRMIYLVADNLNLKSTELFKTDLVALGSSRALDRLFRSPDTTSRKNDSSQTASRKPSYAELLTSYRAALQQYKKDEFAGAMQKFANADSNKLFIDEYDDVATKYLSALNEYWLITLPLRETNDTARLAILDPGKVADTVQNELNFIQGLYRLYTRQPQPPDTIPYDIGDENIPETAITMTNGDSTNNFYFDLLNKSVVNQPLYFGRFRYGTWDFGTSTVPFRYRFGQPKAHIITQAGVDTSVQEGTSESDASISLSVYFGRKWGRTRFYQNPALTTNTIAFEPVVLTGPTLIALSLSNVDSSSHYANYKRNYSYSGPSNMIAWSFGTGFSVQYKTISAGLFIGLDVPLTGHTGWIYADKPWIGFGIGLNLGMLTSGNSVN